jgi:cholesterol oxidase
LNLLLEVALPGLERSHDLKRARASRIPKAIAEALESLLATQSAEELELGLVEISSGATPPRATKPPGSRSRRDAPRITFALASCQYPAGMLNYEIAEASYRRLASRLEPDSKKTKPQFLILIGDQIYVDATAGMFDPTDQFDRFVRPYNAFFRMHAVRNVLRRLPAYMMLDDHEIEDNWEPLAWRTKSDPNLELSRELYLRFQRAGGPPREKPIGDSKEPLWYTFEIDAFPFFIADTRTERDPRTAASIDTARIMSDAQFERILRGLSDQDDDVPKFIATPAILLPRRLRATQHNHPASALRSDAWDGYPFSFHRLLAYIAEKQIRNVVFLSGDEHLSCIAEATITPPGRRRPTSIRSVHASALHAPLPFANSVRDDFAACETFEFSLPRDGRLYAGVRLEGTYACKVSTEFAPAGDGFAVIQVLLDRGRWVVSCDFDRAERDIRGGGTTTGRATSAI